MDYEAALDLRHLSPSSLSRFQNDRASWVAGYLYKIWSEMGPAVWRGKAVEGGFEHMVRKTSTDPLEAAYDVFDLEAMGELSDKIEKERGSIPDMLKILQEEHLQNFGDLVATQLKVEMWFDGAPLPVIGYPDFIFDGYCIDLKTTLRLPSAPKPDHLLQACFYAMSRGEDRAGLLYVTPKKSRIDWLGPDEIEYAKGVLAGRAKAVGDCLKAAQLLSISEGVDLREAMARMSPPDFSSFYWDDNTAFRAIEKIPAWNDFMPMSEAA